MLINRIIEKEEWTLVQEELKRRANRKYAYQNANPYLTKLICDDCWHFFGVKVFHSTDKYKKKVLVCNGKYKCSCHSPSLDPEIVNKSFVEAYNQVMNNKETLIEDAKAIIQLLTNTSDLDDRIQKLNTEMEETELLVENLIHDNAKRSQSQEDYEKHYNELVEKFEKAKDKAESLVEEKADKINKKDVLEAFIKTIEAKENIIDKFSVDLWNLMIQEAIVHQDKTITFKFKNGKEITI